MVNGVWLFFNFSIDCLVDFFLILFELLDGIEVFKFFLFDMDVEFIGGIVNLCFCKVLKDFKFLSRFFKGYNNLNDDYGDYKVLF